MQISTPNLRKYIPLAIVFAVLVLFMPRTAKFNYNYRKGSPWPYETLVSQFDFPILKTEEQIREERRDAGSIVVPYYKYSQEISSQVLKGVQSLDLGTYAKLRPSIVMRLEDIYDKGVISDSKLKLDYTSASVSDNLIFVQKNNRAVRTALSEVYHLAEAKAQLVSALTKTYPDVNLDSLFRRSGIYSYMTPNLVFDRTMTELTHAESNDYVAPTLGYVRADEKIVSKGEIVTAEIAQILDSYKKEYNQVYGYSGPRFLLYAGNFIIAALLTVLLFLAIWTCARFVFDEYNRYLYILALFLLAAIITYVIELANPDLMYLIPYPVLALYLLAFFRKKQVMPIYTVMLLPLLVFCGNGMKLFVMFIAAGYVAIETFSYFSKGWRQFINAAIIFGVELVVYVGFHFIDVGSNAAWYMDLMYIFVGSLLTVLLYPVIYLFERIFNLVSVTRLVEMADTNNPLLQELASKAPGSFQHSLQLMNMVDSVGQTVDANVALLRAAALYHDIGKMQNPMCFVENESLAQEVKYHEGKDPRESAADIIRHVDDGIAIAEDHNLPSVVKDFILTHHGTSAATYFLNKYLNAGGDPSDEPLFRYHGKKPFTKEQVILMICDSVEAASRTLPDYTPETCDRFVEGIVRGKEKDGQLEDADITIHELGLIKSHLKTYLTQTHHSRVVYPKRKIR